MINLIRETPNDQTLGNEVRVRMKTKKPIDVRGMTVTYKGIEITQKELEVLAFNKTKSNG